MISNALFKDLGSVANGGAICSSGRDISIKCCKFILNKVSQQGGSINFQNGKLAISKTMFYECYSSNNTNNVRGNAIYMNTNEFLLNDSTTCLCGKTAKLCSDSSISIYLSKVVVEEYNASNNYGVHGASFIEIRSGVDGSKVEYSQCIDCKDTYEIISLDKWYKAEKCNFIDCASCNYVIYESGDNMMTLISCLFWNLNKAQLSHSGHVIKLINCTSNCETSPSVERVSDFLPNIIRIATKECAIITRNIYRNRSTHNISEISFIMMIILAS